MKWFHFTMFVAWMAGAFAAIVAGTQTNDWRYMVPALIVALIAMLNAGRHMNSLERRTTRPRRCNLSGDNHDK